MRDRCNHDLRIKVDLNGAEEKRRMPEPVKGQRDMLEAGYATLDQAETSGDFISKERRGLARDANYPRRY
ncbi:MAG: hypothetical protein ABFD96_05990 [Armatimonadia bacterium]